MRDRQKGSGLKNKKKVSNIKNELEKKPNLLDGFGSVLKSYKHTQPWSPHKKAHIYAMHCKSHISSTFITENSS